VTSIARAAAMLRLSEQDLTAYLALQPWVEAATVRFAGADEVTVSGSFGVPGVPGLSSPRAELRGRVLARGSQLLLRVEAITLGGRAAPGLVNRVLEQTLNPLVDLADHAVPSRVDSVEVSGGELVIRASGSDLSLRPPPPR
jgi:hypothetical protein